MGITKFLLEKQNPIYVRLFVVFLIVNLISPAIFSLFSNPILFLIDVATMPTLTLSLLTGLAAPILFLFYLSFLFLSVLAIHGIMKREKLTIYVLTAIALINIFFVFYNIESRVFYISRHVASAAFLFLFILIESFKGEKWFKVTDKNNNKSTKRVLFTFMIIMVLSFLVSFGSIVPYPASASARAAALEICEGVSDLEINGEPVQKERVIIGGSFKTRQEVLINFERRDETDLNFQYYFIQLRFFDPSEGKIYEGYKDETELRFQYRKKEYDGTEVRNTIADCNPIGEEKDIETKIVITEYNGPGRTISGCFIGKKVCGYNDGRGWGNYTVVTIEGRFEGPLQTRVNPFYRPGFNYEE